MTTRNCKVRFCENNILQLTSATISYSSEQTGFEFSNALTTFRNKVWKPSGRFDITATNNLIYINDGSNKTATIAVGTYLTPSLLATEIQTKLNAVSTTWGCTYSTTTKLFTITRVGAATMRFTQIANSAWSTIGYNGIADVTSTSWIAEETRRHTSEWFSVDFGYMADCSFFASIAPIKESLRLTSSAVITVMGNNINDFTAPPLSEVVSFDEFGAFGFFDATGSTTYRYWKVKIVDNANYEDMQFSVLYLGDYVTFDSRNISKGFSYSLNDVSESVTSESGVEYFIDKHQKTDIESMSINVMDKTDREDLASIYKKMGKINPFFISLDPTEAISYSMSELIKYVTFDGSLKFTHVFFDKFNATFSVKEVM